MAGKRSLFTNSRRDFLKTGTRLAGWWAMAAAGLPALARPRALLSEFCPILEGSIPAPAAARPRNWSPLAQALDRFQQHEHRFACERQFLTLTPGIEQLRAALRAGGAGLENLLSPAFRGRRLTPERETILRRDALFEVRRSEWDGHDGKQATAAEFGSELRRWIQPHAPLELSDLECLDIRAPEESPDPVKLRARIRFELAGRAAAADSAEGHARWQAVGEWDMGWERAAAGGGAATASSGGAWQIVSWQPVETLVTFGPEHAFTDVTAAAFGADPSYRTHLLRDANYWRTVLDTASGVEIFADHGVSVGDADGDGQDEIYLCQPQGLPNRLYRQRAPGVFEDVAAEAGVDLLDPTSMALFADVLNRGRQDLIVITEASPVLFLNDGGGRFKLAANAFPGGAQEVALTGAALGDYDRDGFLDLFVCSYNYFQGQGTAPIPAPYYDARNGPSNHLYRNRGDGTFEDVTARSGLTRGNGRFSFACAWHDIDNDGWPDLVVVNDFGRNNLYRNRGDGTFEDLSETLQDHGSGMSVSVADLDGNGEAEIYVANMSSAAGERVTGDAGFQSRFSRTALDSMRQFALGNVLYRQTREAGGKGRIEQVPLAAGASWGRWAYCTDAFDLENDGHLDLYMVNGFLSAADPKPGTLDAYLWEDIIALSPETDAVGSEYRSSWTASFELAHADHSWDGDQRNVFFLNLGDGNFADASAVTGLDFRDDGRGFAVFDFDGDGDSDLVVHSRTGPQLRLLRNEIGQGRRAVALRLRATKGNRDAIGARVEIETPSRRIVRWLACGSGFLAQHTKELMFGLGDDAPGPSTVAAHVRWPGGSVQTFPNLAPGYRYHLVEGEPDPRREAFRQSAPAGSSLPNQVVTAEPAPDRFSGWLIDPLPLPPIPAFSLPRAAAASSGSLGARRSLVWLWDANTSPDATLAAFLAVQNQLPSRLIVWTGDAPASLASQLAAPAIAADDRLRTFFTTLLGYIFDRRRAPAMPTGLLLDRGSGPEDPASLVRIYWGGATAEEIRRDARAPGLTGAAALPFPGRAHLCSFTRDTRVLGAALAFRGLYAESEPYLERALEANRKDADAAYNLALAARELKKPELAFSSIQTALAARPHFPEAENMLGVLLMQAGRIPEARSHLEQATAAAPDFAEAWNNLGYLWLGQGNLSSARTAVEKALAIAPDFPEALNNLGIIAAREGKPDEAGGLFRKALAADPENEQAGNNLGVLEAKQGRTADAIATFKGVLERNQEAASVLLNLARLDLSTGQSAEALRVLEPWLERHPDDAAAQQLMARARAGQSASH
jgi:Tfp pilus assembly protein PilF